MAGVLIFAMRSFAPLPVIAWVVWETWRGHVSPGPGGAEVDNMFNVLGVGLCTTGSVIRFVTVGLVGEGTSSQSRRLQARALNTQGLYSLVRHPLYLGGFFITLGLLFIVNEPVAWAVGLGYFLVSHALITRAEEDLLRRTFSTEFEIWAAKTPAWVPDLSLWRSSESPFAWKRAFQRELTPSVGWGMGATLLLGWEYFARSELTADLARHGGLVLVGFLMLLIANKVWKKVSRA